MHIYMWQRFKHRVTVKIMSAHEGPGGPAMAQPTRAQEGPQGPIAKGPRRLINPAAMGSSILYIHIYIYVYIYKYGA